VKVLGYEFGPAKSWTSKLKVLESPGVYLWFKLTNMPRARFALLLTETSDSEF